MSHIQAQGPLGGTVESRIALGAPVALTDDGLAISAPGDEGEAWLDPGISIDESSSMTTMNYSPPPSYYPPPPPPPQPPYARTPTGSSSAA